MILRLKLWNYDYMNDNVEGLHRNDAVTFVTFERGIFQRLAQRL